MAMADEKERKKANEKEEEEEEAKIPVFTVLKNGAILKNIFIVNKPPPPPNHHNKPISSAHQQTQEEILIVGRHPDCNIVLTHPSISRFHLQILSNPRSQKLSVTDLSSVHGTWVSDKKIEAGVRVELKEGDTLRVGSSSRVYSLHWIPLSRAYDFETPFVPFPKPEQDQNADEVDQSEISLPAENKENESPDSNSEGIESMFSDEILGFIGKKEIPSAPPMPDNAIYSCSDLSEEGGERSSKDNHKEKEISSFWAFGTESVNLFLDMEESNPNSKENQCLQQPGFVTEEVSERENPESSSFVGIENQSPVRTNHGQADICCLSTRPLVMEKLSLPTGEVPRDPKTEKIEEENLIPEPDSNFLVNLNFEPCDEKEVETENPNPFRKGDGCADISCLLTGPLVIGEVLGKTKNQLVEEENMTPEPKPDLLVNLSFEHSDEKETEAYHAAQVPAKTENQCPLEKDQGQIDVSCVSSGILVLENLQIGEVFGEAKDEQVEQESLTPEPKANLLVDLNFEHFNEREEEAYPAPYPAPEVPNKIDNQSPLRKDDGQIHISCLLSGPLVMEKLSIPIGEVLGEIEDQQVAADSLNPEPRSNLLFNLISQHSDETGCLVDERLGETENKSKPLEFHDKRDTTSICCAPLMTESVNSSAPDGILSELVDDNKSQTTQSLFTAAGQPESEFCESPPLRSENKPSMKGSIWARRGKPDSVVQIQTDKSRENATEEKYDDDIEQEEEIFTPDKENFTPNTLRLRSLKKKGEVVKHSKSHESFSSKLTLISSIHQQHLVVSPEIDNQKLKELRERKSVRTTSGNQAMLDKKSTVSNIRRERMPFQSLKNSGGKKRSEALVPNTATRSSTSLSCTQTAEKVAIPLSNYSVGEGKRGWTMVADTTTLLDKESRKSLLLLQGLKWTRLIIPRMVIRELDCLKQRGSLFRKKTEACLVLEWIEECMGKTNWWIHVQSSMEDARLIAPTPPASPQSQFSEKGWDIPSATTSSFPFSRCRSSMDLVSPASEDHIIDCALLQRKMKNDGQLVLLSNDVTLKIKAMAEGLLCETAEAFRESLVSPFSERFMWPDSSPRGRTWSYLPDVVLREKYRCPLKKSSKGEGAKGLKLILLHNSLYGQIR